MKDVDVLRDSGLPLFFIAEDPARPGLPLPESRLDGTVRVYCRSLAGMQKEAWIRRTGSGALWRLASDEGPYLAGRDAAPCPLAFMTTGMVGSYMDEILALAAQRGINVRHLRLVQDNFYTMAGSALQGTMTGGAKNVALTVQIDADAGRDALDSLVADAVAASPLHGLMRASKPSLFALTHNGRSVQPGRVARIDSGAEPSDVEPATAAPAPGDWSAVVRRGGLTPKASHSVTLSGDSLREQQRRLLHVRGICTLREDGLKQVEQRLYNPHGSVFHLLCGDTDAALSAPDPLSYIAAGIAFCFMTQFGRYAQIAKRDLRNYRIVQDMHYARDGAHGDIAPLETWVHLDTGEDDETARTMLDMAEQTCFLHALCRSVIATDFVVEPYVEGAELPPAEAAPA